MKKLFTGTIIALMAMAIFTVTAFAAPKNQKEEVGPFEGVFAGTVSGSRGSEAFMMLNLDDRDNLVSGTAFLGRGLEVNAGSVCGSAVLPATTLPVSGAKSARHPDEISAAAPFEVSGFQVTVEVTGELSRDGDTLDVEAKIDVPWICGRDPVISGTLTRTG